MNNLPKTYSFNLKPGVYNRIQDDEDLLELEDLLLDKLEAKFGKYPLSWDCELSETKLTFFNLEW